MTKRFRCEGCNSAEHGNPFTFCSHCHADYFQLKALAKDLDKRFNVGSFNLYFAFKGALNALVAIINQQKSEIAELRRQVKGG